MTEPAPLYVELSKGAEAERLVVDRLRAVLPPDVAVLHGVRWLARDRGYVREGEADVVIGDPARGILVIEVKAGEVRRDDLGTWWVGRVALKRTPFEQAADSRHALIRKLAESPGWTAGLWPIAGQAVAFPNVELDSMRGRLGLLGPDVDVDLIADQSTFVDDAGGRAELARFVDRAFESWSGQAGTRAPGRAAIDLLVATMTEPFELRPMLRNEIAGGEPEAVRLTTTQYSVLNTLRDIRRASIVGGAGTGKTMLAVEKARRLARQGFRTLLVCFNSPLAQMLAEEAEAVARDTGLLEVKTFHQLCEDMGREAGVLGERPVLVPQDWWDRALPRALDDAVSALGPRYHAIVVDEGQDFVDEWLLSLETLLFGGREDVLYVFHDPAQAIYRDDIVAGLGMPEIPLDQNCRNAQPIHELVSRFAGPGMAPLALRHDGREPEFIEADGPQATVAALRKLLHRLRVEEEVRPWEIAVLTGARLEGSVVWGVPDRRFGNEVLGNPAVDDAGRNVGLAAHLVPPLPTDVILCDTIRRFKGLERPVIVLVELDPTDARLERLLYIGASRARQHLVVIAPWAVLERLGRPGRGARSETQDEPERGIDASDSLGAQATGLRSEQECRERHRLVALGPTVARQPRFVTADLDQERRPEFGGLGGTRQRDDHDRGRAAHQIRLDDDPRVRTPDDMTADVREIHEMDVPARRSDDRRRMADAYHSSSDQSLAAIGRYAIAHSRFSSFWASMAASNRAWSESWSVRRSEAPIVALTLSPVWAAASRTSSTTSLGRLMDSFLWGAFVSSAPYGAISSANALDEYDQSSLTVGRIVG